VYDANTRSPVRGITVTSDSGDSVTSGPGGAYAVSAAPGARTLRADSPPALKYGPASVHVSVTRAGAVKKDILIPAGRLIPEPETITVTLAKGSRKTLAVRAANKGGRTASFTYGGTMPVNTAWLSMSPASGTVAARRSLAMSVTVDSTGIEPGSYEAWIFANTDTPYGRSLAFKVTMNVTGP
jgi:hypothetical protein